MERVLEPGDAFVDVGAHAGYFSVIASEAVGPEGEVHSFEPNGTTFELLRTSIITNSFANVRPNRIALWNERTSVSISVGGDSGFCHVVPSSSSESTAAANQVQAISFDDYAKAAAGRPIKLVKIDVEDAEHLVLLGMQEVLHSHRPNLIIEAQDWSLARFGHRLEPDLSLTWEGRLLLVRPGRSSAPRCRRSGLNLGGQLGEEPGFEAA